MTANRLVTGRPRVGKSTVLERSVDRLKSHGLRPGGVRAPERRQEGERVGFTLEDVMTGESVVMAHVERSDGPAVGKYRVDVGAVDRLSREAFDRAFDTADLFVVDEIAPMEGHSGAFVEAVMRALDSSRPLLGAVHRSTTGFAGAVKARGDTEVTTITRDNRDALPERLAATILAAERPGDDI